MTMAMTVQINANISEVSTVKTLADEWLAFIDVAPNTALTYRRAMKNFVAWLAENKISSISREIVIAYRDECLKKLSVSTARLYLATVKLFVRFLSTKGICADFTNHLKSVKVTSEVHSRQALTVDEARKVFHSMKGETEKSLRDKAVVGLMMSTGLRTVEVTRLDVGDIERRGNKLYLKVHGKARAGKQDRVLLPAQCAQLIKSYLAKRGNVASNAPLFVSTSRRCKGQRLETQTISRLAKKALVNAGFQSESITAHSLRHSFATAAIQAGVDIRQVSRALRHKSVTVTEVYFHDLDAENNNACSVVANLIF